MVNKKMMIIPASTVCYIVRVAHNSQNRIKPNTQNRIKPNDYFPRG